MLAGAGDDVLALGEGSRRLRVEREAGLSCKYECAEEDCRVKKDDDANSCLLEPRQEEGV